MKKVVLFVTITSVLLISFKSVDTASVSTQTSTADQQQPVLGAASSENAAVPFNVIVNENLDGFQFYNSCTNELVTLYGTDHYVFHGVYDGANSKSTANLTVPATIRAVGESGREYTFTGTLNAQEGEYSPGQFTFKFIFMYRIIAKGGGNNFFYELTHYLKVDAQGNWTVIRGEVESTYCQ